MRIYKRLYVLSVMLLFLLAACSKEAEPLKETPTEEILLPSIIATPTATSDKPDYAPGDTVILNGAGWQANESVHIFVNDDAGQTWSHDSNPDPVADESGSFTYSFQLPSWFVATYTVVATGSSGVTARTTFTDSNVGTYDQCSNDDGDGYASGNTGCRWINGNLQSNNSTYFEGDATVQRLSLTDNIPGSSHTVTFQYGTTKGGKHAYDFLTTWNWSEDWITVADRCEGIAGCETASETALDIPQDPNVPDSFEPSAPGVRQFVMRGGTITAVSTPTIVSGTYAGDSETAITVTFTVGPSTGSMCSTKQGTTTCTVAIWFGAHVAAQANWGLGQGAGSISGSPYHVSLDKVDNEAIGERDNQMQANAVTPNGTIVIVKDTVPNDAQDFNFNLTNGDINQNFSLDDDADGTLQNSQTFSVPPGTWSASELNIPTGWSLSNLVCVDPTNNTTVNLGAGTASINLTSLETVTCTFTNSRNAGSLTLKKSLTGGPAGYTGPFTIHYDCGAFGSGDKTVAAGGSETISSIPAGTQCTVSEPTLPAAPAGYIFGTPTFSPSATVTISSSTTVEVTTNNSLTRITPDVATLILAKSLTGGPSGYTGPFTINYDCGPGNPSGSKTVAAGAQELVTIPLYNANGNPLTPITCTISEILPDPAPTGYTFGTPTFSPSNSVVFTTGMPSYEVTVTTNNTLTRDQGYLKISKVFDPLTSGFAGDFAINYNCGSGDVTVSLAAGASTTVGPFDTGTSCTVTEPNLPTAPTGWTFGTPSVSGSPATIVKGDQAAAVEVAVTNTISRDLGSLQILKTLDNPDGAPVPASFSVDYDCGAGYTGNVSVAPGSPATVNGIPTGNTCTVTEIAPAAIDGYTWGTISYSPTSVVILKDATVDITVGNAITRDRGSLIISKTLSNPDGAPVPASFNVNYDCGSGYTGTVSVAPGAPATVPGIPTGNTCTVTEVAPDPIPGYTWGTISYSPASVTIDTNGGTFEISVGNSITRDRGSLKLTKSLTGGPSGYNGPFTINYDCTEGPDGSVTIAAGASETINGVPTGTQCTVSETLPSAPTGYSFGTPTFSPDATVSITDKDVTVEVTTNNTLTRDTGSLKLSKSLTGGPAGYAGPFTINYTCNDDPAHTGSVSINAGAAETISGIPTGTQCTVSETLPSAPTGYSFGTPTFTPDATVTIADKDVTVEVTTNNTLTRDLGSLVLAKNLSGGPAGYTGPFTIHYDCADFGSGDATVSVGSPATISNIPTGTQCTVSETTFPTVPGYTFGTPTFDPSDTVQIPAGNGSSVTVTTNNSLTRDTGSLKVLKTLDNPGGASVPASFSVDYDCGSGYTGNVSVAPGSPATVSGIPTGSTCTVTEIAPAAIPGYTWGAISYSPASVTIDTKDGTFEITVGNSITRDTGSLKLTKALSGGPSGYTGPFTIDYDCDDGTAHDGSVSINAGASQTISGIPTGTQCTVSETVPVAPTGYTFGTPTFSPAATITISDKDVTVEVTTNNTLTRDTGSLVIKKTLSNPDGASVPASFSVNYNCGTGYTGNVSVSPSSPATVSGIPTGNICTVTEVAPAAITGYTWGTITYTPASVTIATKDGTFEITVGNSITRDRGTIVIVKNAKPAQGSFAFNTTGNSSSSGTSWPSSFTLTGSTAGGGNTKTFTVDTGTYTVKESTQLGWILTGIGGSADPNTPYNCTVTGSGGSTGVGDLNTQTATINLKKGDTVTCVFENTGNGVTRTQGFWATHPQLAEIAWFGGTRFGHTFPGVSGISAIGDKLICTRELNTLGKLTGAFWSDISKTSTGAKRSALDQARMQLLQQLIAAELNASAFGSAPSGDPSKFAAWEAALCGTDTNAIKTAQQQAASFNSNGDSGTFTPGTSADSKYARSIADIPFWNIIKPVTP
jgi:hypothetical protein